MTTITQQDPAIKRGDIVLVLTDNLATISELAIDRIIGRLPMRDVNKALRYTLGL